MSNIQEIEDIIESLTRAEKAEILKWIVQDLGDAFPGIDFTPVICGGEARIVRTRIPVVQELRNLGYDVLTIQEAGQHKQALSDDLVLM